MGIPILRLKDADGNIVPVPAIQGADGKSAYEFALEGGYTGSKEEFAEQLATGAPGGGSGPGVSVKKYGAKGDGQTDDTAAFQSALAAERVVFVPGGTYILSGTLVIAENCCMELSQDTVLQFGQTNGNCIEMRGSATLRGNHAIISVPYAFTGSVIALDTALDGEDHNSIPPYLKAGSNMFKRQRFVYDVNIIKPDAVGFCRSDDGKCNGTAIYMSCEGTASIRWMWAITMSGIRIAGGFSYGIRAANFDDPEDYEDNAWNHDMRIEAVIEACEVGVSLENCNNAHLAVTVQPCAAIDGTLYAKWGFYLNDAKNADLGSCCVWDWANTSLWQRGGEYQHIALIGQCRGLVLSDFLYYESGEDIRSLIYTDTASNLENMTIMQEPITRWFRPVDNEPYFYDGTALRRLAMKSDLDEYFQTDRVAGYTDALASAIDTDGSVYNGIGYNRYGGALSSDGVTIIADTEAWYGHTGYIPCKQGDTIYVKNILIAESDGYTKAFLYDADFNFIGQNNTAAIIAGTTVGVFTGTAAEDGGTLTPVKANAAYMRLGFKATLMGTDPIISVNDEIVFEQAGFLADSIKVRAENVVGAVSGGGSEWTKIADTTITTQVEFIPVSIESGVVTIDPADENYSMLPSSGRVVVALAKNDIAAKDLNTGCLYRLLEAIDYEAGTFQLRDGDGIAQTVSYDVATYKLILGTVGTVSVSGISQYKRYKLRYTTPYHCTHGLRQVFTCPNLPALQFPAMVSASASGGVIYEVEAEPCMDGKYAYIRRKLIRSHSYGGNNANNLDSVVLDSADRLTLAGDGVISFGRMSTVFVKGARFEIWGSNT